MMMPPAKKELRSGNFHLQMLHPLPLRQTSPCEVMGRFEALEAREVTWQALLSGSRVGSRSWRQLPGTRGISSLFHF